MIENWKEGVDYPEWMKEEGLKTLRRQHLLDNETPKEMYERITECLYERLICDFGDDVQTKDVNREHILKINGLNIYGKVGYAQLLLY